jgi:cytochrome c
MPAEARRRARTRRHGIAVAVLAALALGCAACEDQVGRTARQLTGGDPDRAPAAIRKYGCGSCHTIPGIPGAHAVVAPPLDRFGVRSYIAGRVNNDAATLIRWIQHPHSIDSKTAMPEMGVGSQDARDIAAYLYTLR